MTNLISLRQAASLCGKAESTISKALKSGKMKFVRKTSNGQGYMIDPAEALRVYPKRHGSSFGAGDNSEKDHLIADLRAERDAWRQMAQLLAQGKAV